MPENRRAFVRTEPVPDAEAELLYPSHPAYLGVALAQLFRDYAVASVTIKPGRYAVVAFETPWEADRALKEWAGWVWGGQWLRLKAANW